MARYLVVAHQTASSPELMKAVLGIVKQERAVEFTLVVPATPPGVRLCGRRARPVLSLRNAWMPPSLP